MDQLKGVDKRPWIDSEKINVRQFLSLWGSQDLSFELDLNEKNLDEKAMEIANVDKEIIDSVKEDLNPDCLVAEGDTIWKDCLYGNNFPLPSHVNLRSVSASIAHIERCETDVKYRNLANQMLKYKNYKFLNSQEVKHNLIGEPKIDGLDVILNVQIFRPMHHSLFVGDHRKHVNPIAEQEFLCLGQQSLAALRDEIVCPVEANPAEDCSSEPNKEKSRAGELYTSSFFFIDDCFYNDLRKTTSIDYSQVIMEWARNSDRGIGPLISSRMEDTHFIDLSIRLGQPYVFVHQGNCEHMVVFSEIRLYSPQTDSPYIKDYPKVFKTVNRNARKCFMCRINVAKWLVFGNKRLPEEPYFFCQECFFSFNYDSEKKKIGDFKAFPYLDNSAFL